MNCICNEMIEKCDIAQALTFECCSHGRVTVDNRKLSHTLVGSNTATRFNRRPSGPRPIPQKIYPRNVS